MGEYIGPFHVARYKGYLTALEDVLEELEKNSEADLKKWIQGRISRIKRILDQDRREKFHYWLKEHENILG